MGTAQLLAAVISTPHPCKATQTGWLAYAGSAPEPACVSPMRRLLTYLSNSFVSSFTVMWMPVGFRLSYLHSHSLLF